MTQLVRPAAAGVVAGGWTRLATALYGPIATTASFLAATLPFAAAVAVAPALGAAGPLAVAAGGCAIGPAWVAALFGMRGGGADADAPFRRYWRAYRESGRQALTFWAPFWLLLAVLAFDLASGAVTGPAAWLLGALAVAGMIWAGTVLVIVAFFAFRLRDALRLAAYGMLRSPRWVGAQVVLLVGLGAVVLGGSEVAAGVLVAPFALATGWAARGMVGRLAVEFTR